ncbi:hypothetical protein CP968_02475 [Streptomyces subrutilus]|uniref:Uncharacterized protein n=1 Tax=Streptomyces subrutilus TaxID=36818 RepID=A0A5P2UDF2_9ACTN|nr:hypothetical protein CP968_02475 [Streptomyces subrutilus]
MGIGASGRIGGMGVPNGADIEPAGAARRLPAATRGRPLAYADGLAETLRGPLGDRLGPLPRLSLICSQPQWN